MKEDSGQGIVNFLITLRLRQLYMSRRAAPDVIYDGRPCNVVRIRSKDREARLGNWWALIRMAASALHGASGWLYISPIILPLWKCMRSSLNLLSLLIPQSRAPGREIKVYLQLSIDRVKDITRRGIMRPFVILKRVILGCTSRCFASSMVFLPTVTYLDGVGKIADYAQNAMIAPLWDYVTRFVSWGIDVS